MKLGDTSPHHTYFISFEVWLAPTPRFNRPINVSTDAYTEIRTNPCNGSTDSEPGKIKYGVDG